MRISLTSVFTFRSELDNYCEELRPLLKQLVSCNSIADWLFVPILAFRKCTMYAKGLAVYKLSILVIRKCTMYTIGLAVYKLSLPAFRKCIQCMQKVYQFINWWFVSILAFWRHLNGIPRIPSGGQDQAVVLSERTLPESSGPAMPQSAPSLTPHGQNYWTLSYS